MANREIDQVWDMDLMKQQLVQLRKEVSHTQQELERTRKAGERRWRDEAELRRLVQDGHLREKHLRSRYQELLKLDEAEGPSDPSGSPQSAHQTGPMARAGGRGLLERIDPFIVDRIAGEDAPTNGWPTPESILPVLNVHPGWGNYASLGEEGVVIGMSLLGLDGNESAEVIDLISAQQLRNPQLFPVFITDVDDFSILRAEHFVFEYLPPWPGDDVVPSRIKWEGFLLERLALIKRKWGIRRFISFRAGASEPERGQAFSAEIMRHEPTDATED